MLLTARRLLSGLLCFVLVAETPGPAYQAAAAVFESQGRALPAPLTLPSAPALPLLPGSPVLTSQAGLPALAPQAALPAAAPFAAAQAAPQADASFKNAPQAAAQSVEAGRAAAAAVSPASAVDSAGAGLDAVYSGAAAPKTGDSIAVSAAASQPAPELATQTLDVSAFGGLRARLKTAFSRLPLDAHRAPAAGRRFRAAAELEIRPSADGTLDLRATPGATFLAKSAEARLPGIEAQVVLDPQFRGLVEALYARLPESVRQRGVRVSVHQMRVEDGSVTEGPHQDPHAEYLAIWAVDRSNAKGGETRLSRTAAGETSFKKTLTSDEILLFDNRTNFHDATTLARRAFWKESRRDALVLAMSALPAAAVSLTAADRAAARNLIAAEMSKPVPDAEALRPFYETGDPRLQRGLYRAFKRWSRYFSPGGAAPDALWKLVKGASAPWAGHVYVKKLVSVLEFLAQARGQQIDAEKAAKEIHAADHAFSKAFVEQAEKRAPQGLDAEEAADAISDSVIYPALIEPLMERRQKGVFDRKAILGDVARRLKDTVYLYSPMSIDDITQVLSQPEMVARLDTLIDLIEDQLPPEDPKTPSSAAKLPPAKHSRRLSGGGMAMIALFAGSAALHALTGHDFGLAALGVLAIGALQDSAQPQPDRRNAPQAEDPNAPKKPAEGPSPYLIDLTQMARRGEIPPIYLRDEETAKTIQILNQKNYNNVVLIGEPGVGKTAIAEGLALRVAAGKTGTALDGQRVLLLDIGRFMAEAAGSPDRFAAAVEEIVKEAADGNTTLVIDEAHQLARDPDMPSGMGSFFDQIKRVMTQGRLKLILATTRDEYNRYFARDRALESRSQVLFVEPVAEGPAMELLYRIRGQFEQGVTISFGAAKAAVELTVRAFRFDALLRMAIKAMDTAATRLRIRPALVKSRLLDVRKDLLYHLELLRAARAQNDLERQENLVPQVEALVERYAALQAESLVPARTAVTRDDVSEAMQELGAPVHSLKAGTQEYIDGIDAFLRKNLIGHDTLIDSTVAALKRRFAQPNLRKPIFSALLLGPTGTGKTEFARLLARGLFGIKDFDKDAIKIDGGAHQHKHDISRIQGSPPGYVGFNATETLMDQVRRKPESIILVDEVEKMHPDILSLFLSILEDGTAKDSLGRPVDFSHTVILFTSNFGVPPGDYEKMSDADFIAHVKGRLKEPFPVSPFKPEMLNRPSLVDIFTPLKTEEVRRIVELRVSQVEENWKKTHGVDVRFPDREALVAKLLEEGFDARNGARPVNRAVDKRLDAPLSELLIAQKLRRGDRVSLRSDWTTEIEQAPADQRAPGLVGAAPEARALAARLEALLGETKSALTLDALDAALDAAVPDFAAAGVAPRVMPAAFLASRDPETLADHRPGAADPKLKAALDRLRGDVGAHPGFDQEALLKAVKALALKAKRLDLEAETRAVEGPHWTRGFEDMEKEAGDLTGPAKPALQKKLQEIVEAAGKSRTVSLSWQARPDAVVVSVQASARLTYEEEDKLLALLAPRAAEGPARLEGARDGTLEQARKDVAAASGRLGYSRDGDRTTLWLEWPLQAAPAAAAAAEKTETQAAPVAAPAKTEPAPQPAAAAVVEPVPVAAVAVPETLRRRRPARADDDSLNGERNELLKKAAALTDAEYTDREIAASAQAVSAALDARPELASRELEQALWRGVMAFSKYVDELRRNNHQLEEIALDKSGASPMPSLRFREFFQLYRKLLETRPDLAPDDARTQLAQAFVLGHESRNVRNYYALNDDGKAAMNWVWEQLVETAFALNVERPQLVSEEWLNGQLGNDLRWPSYQLERRAERLAQPGVPDDEARTLGNALAQALGKNPKAATARLTDALYAAVDAFRAQAEKDPASAPPESAQAAARLALALAEVRPELAGARETETLRAWLLLDPAAGPAAAWLSAQGVELGLMLERKRPGLSPWKEMEVRLKGDARWTQMVLIRHASVLRDDKSSAEAAVEAANELGKALAERPQEATPELEALLWGGVDVHLKALTVGRREPISAALVTLVGGRAMPVRRAREMYELYRRLIENRPDLAPADTVKRLTESLSHARLREWQHGYDEGFFRHDQAASQTIQWSLKQLEDVALLLSEKRPDLIKMTDALILYDYATKRVAERHSFALGDLWTILIAAAGEAVGLIVIFGNDVKWPHWTLLLPVALLGLRFVYLTARQWRERPAYKALAARLRQETLRRMRAQPPIDTLRAIAAFDSEAGVWRPAKGRAELFKDLLKWPEFNQEAEGRGLGKAVEGDEKRLGELAGTLADLQVPADTARDAAQRLTAALREHPDAADIDLKILLRKAALAAAARVGENKETLAALGGRPAPSLRSRNVVEIFAQLLALRPDLADAEERAALQKLLAVDGNEDHRSAAGWLQEQAAAVSAGLDAARPELLRAKDQHVFYTESLRASPKGLDGFRSEKSADFRLLWSILGTAAAVIGLGAFALWHPAGFWMWVTLGLGVPGAVVLLLGWSFWGVQRLRAGRGLKALDGSLETLLVGGLRRGTPRAALDLVGEFDGEREVWFAKPGQAPVFNRLVREWPEFQAAAGAKTK